LRATIEARRVRETAQSPATPAQWAPSI